MSRDIKVTDKRIFTAEGDLKEEYRHLEEAAETSAASPSTDQPRQEGPTAESPIVPPSTPSPEEPARERSAAPSGAPSGARAGDVSPGERFEGPGAPDEMGSPDFLDLVSMLAQPAALYLGDARLPDGRSAEDLDMARIHIDMLDLLREKTVGNLAPEESSTLEDVLYQLRMRYVRKRG